VKRSIYQWEFIDSIAAKIDDGALKKAQAVHDAVASYEVVYKALGLDDRFVQDIQTSRKKK
jgi:hypothetical protein